MTIRECRTILIILVTLLFSCGLSNETQILNRSADIEGIHIDTLDLINHGPSGFTLEYFPSKSIQSASVKLCQITEDNKSSKRLARTIIFDRQGNVVEDNYSFFSYWFVGTVRGSYRYQYTEDGKLLTTKGIPTEESNDSTMNKHNYNAIGRLTSTETYEFSKKLKQGADSHLPNSSDYEDHPTWHILHTKKFSTIADTVLFETIVNGNVVNTKKYKLHFDASGKLDTLKIFEDGHLSETVEYTYGSSSIKSLLKRGGHQDNQWTYRSKAVLNTNGSQTEKIVFNEDGGEKIKMTVSYNNDGTVKSIKYGNTIQEFKYDYY